MINIEEHFTKKFLWWRYHYITTWTRISYGYSLWCCGKVFKLQRKKSGFWTTIAHTHGAADMKELIDYLYWYVERHDKG